MFIDKLPQAFLSSALKNLEQKDMEAIFSKGDIVEGSVLKTLGEKQALVRFRGVDLMAMTQTRLTEGQKIVGKVESVNPQFTISLIPGRTASEAKTAGLLRLLLPSKAPMGETLARALEAVRGEPGATAGQAGDVLKSLAGDLEKLMSANLEKMVPQDVRQSLKNSGVYLESLLGKAAEGLVTGQELKAGLAGDLKANISKALSIIEGKIADIVANLKTTSEPAATSTATQPQGNPTSKETATPPASQPQSAPKQPPTGAMANEGDGVYKELSRLHDTAKSLRSALSNIELTQLLNSAGKKAGATGEGVMMYQIPYMQNGSPETARVYIKPDDDGEGNSGEGKKGRAKSLVFMLNMTNLGAVRVDVAVGDGHARGFIYVENDDVAAHARESLKELVNALEPAGYRADFVVKTAERKFLVEELETASSPAPSGLVNIRA
ncbi:MAG: hypothetical protein HQK85_03615 [Nitrospinae bacterium]|nr:hypothetical protein [Nitrospinota bacterium]